MKISKTERAQLKTLSKEKIVRFACDCALINVELIKPYTDKYDLIVRFLNTGANAYAAFAAISAAYSSVKAAYATYATVNADYAAISSTQAAACTAFAVNAASEAVNAATYAAIIGTDADEKTNQLLIKLFNIK